MIHTQQLTRHFVSKKETVEAVKGVDIDVAPGELVAFLGPNGAGKSTTLRMLTTLLPPTSGTARGGRRQHRRRAGAACGPGSATSARADGGGHSFRVRDELVMQGRFYGMSSADAARAGDRADADPGPDRRWASGAVSTLSGGQRRRLDVALGLMHPPELLFLDEPSTGMDPQNRANLWEHIERLRERQQTTIVLTTHYLEEADTQAERVLVIDHGEIIADDTAANLKATLAGDRIAVTVDAGRRRRGGGDRGPARVGAEPRRATPWARWWSRASSRGRVRCSGLLRERCMARGSRCGRPRSACPPWTTCSSP